MAVFWHVAPCSLLETDRRFRGTYCFNDQGDELQQQQNLTDSIGREVLVSGTVCSNTEAGINLCAHLSVVSGTDVSNNIQMLTHQICLLVIYLIMRPTAQTIQQRP
jgi:hypothetical protein